MPPLRGLLLLRRVHTPYSDLGTMTLWNVGGIGQQFVGASLYVVLVTVTAMTPASTSDFTIQLGIADD